MTKKNKPVSGTREWAATSVNCTTGCKHDCRYCYAKRRAIKEGKVTPAEWKIMKNRPLTEKFSKRNGTVMFPTTHDITDENIRECCETLTKLLVAGNKVLVVSKPTFETTALLCAAAGPWKDQVLFRFTIGSMNPNTLKFWEPGAPSFAERLTALVLTFKRGWQTSFSMEPMLDPFNEQVIFLAQTLAPYVTDYIWIGKANHLRDRCFTNAGKLSHQEDLLLSGAIRELDHAQNDISIKSLYNSILALPDLAKKVKWKESIKKVVGLPLTEEAGLDI